MNFTQKKVSFNPHVRVRECERILDHTYPSNVNNQNMVAVVLPLTIGWRYNETSQPLQKYTKRSLESKVTTLTYRFDLLTRYGFDFYEMEDFVSNSPPVPVRVEFVDEEDLEVTPLAQKVAYSAPAQNRVTKKFRKMKPKLGKQLVNALSAIAKSSANVR